MKTLRRWMLLAAASTIGLAAPVIDRGKMPMAMYDPVNEITIQGTVERVLTMQRPLTTSPMMGVHLSVKTAEKTFNVRLGPAWFLKEKNFSFAEGDRIEVTGARLGDRDVILAREVTKGDAKLILRDAGGVPEWAMGRRWSMRH